MSGYLPPHTTEGPASKLFQPAYPLTPASVGGGVSESKLFIPAGTTPTTNSLITLDATPPPSQASGTAAAKEGEPVTIRLSAIGFGLWGWGDVLTYGWGPSGGYDQALNEQSIGEAYAKMRELFPHSLFLDDAEYYGYTDGECESQLGRLYGAEAGGDKAVRGHLSVSTKYLPTPWRHPWRYPNIVLEALQGSLDRTRLGHFDIYQLHGPSHLGFWPKLATLCDSLVEAYRTGRVKAIGTCNLGLSQVQYVKERLNSQGVPLVSNQVEFSLVRMDPLTTGLIEGCRRMGVATIAYSPLAVGRLTGKYSAQQLPRGNRNFGHVSWTKIQPIVDELLKVGQQVGKKPAAVALNWVICKGAIPIPTAKNAEQVVDCAQALGWRLSSEQEAALDAVGLTNAWDWNLLKHAQNWWWQQG